jgi:hypothetical protein
VCACTQINKHACIVHVHTHTYLYCAYSIPGGTTWEFCDVETAALDSAGTTTHKMVDKRFVVRSRVDEAHVTARHVGLRSTGLGGREVVMTEDRAREVIMMSALQVDPQEFGRYARITYGNQQQQRDTYIRKV